MHLVVVSVESMGVWCEEGSSWISEIGKMLMEKKEKRNKKLLSTYK